MAEKHHNLVRIRREFCRLPGMGAYLVRKEKTPWL